jgi:hydroxyacylglutathione hydrolase
VLFRQFVDDDLGCASYLIGDRDAGVAVIVDPVFAIEPYLAAAEDEGVRLVRVVETHTHADHVSGHGRLALEHELPVSIHPAAEPDYPFDPLENGAELEAGRALLRAIHTPGHRPEHTAVAVVDREQGEAVQLVLTGDSLFVGAVGRPDLAVEPREGAEGLFHSLHHLLELPDHVQVYPGHVAGSLCGAGMSGDKSSTIGAERRSNRAAGMQSVEEFLAVALGSNAPRPPNMERIVELNRGPFVGRPAELEALSSTDGLTVLDVRDSEKFARGHVEGAINVPVGRSSFATRAGFVLEPTDRIAVHGGSAAEVEHAARGLRAIGYVELAGYLDRPNTPARLDPIGLDELERLLDAGEVRVLDVRESDERDEGYIADSLHIPYRLLRAVDHDLDGGTIVTICESGSRAGIAASLLAAEGIDARPVLGAGVADWEARGGRTVHFRRCGT